MNMNIGLVGFGVMGAAIAPRLISNGYSVLVYDISADAMARAETEGCTASATPSEVARKATIILISLPKPEHVTSIVKEGEDCLLSGTTKGSVIIDTSTVDPQTSQANAKAAEDVGVGYLDCPVLGRPVACGNWTLPTGGDAKYIAMAEPVLKTFAAKIIHVGPSGQGNAIKLLNNLMFGAINSITSEVFALCKQVGIDPKQFFETISTSGAGTVSKLFQELGSKIVNDDYSTIFSIDNLQKDVGLGILMARKNGMKLPISQAGQNLNELAQAEGLGKQDSSAIVKIFAELQ